MRTTPATPVRSTAATWLLVAAFIFACVKTSGLAYVAACLALALVLCRALGQYHDFTHGAQFRSARANQFWGWANSFLVLIPFHPWRRTHLDHHFWVGCVGKDPNEPLEAFSEMPAAIRFIVGLGWRLWIPLVSAGFSLTHYWNLAWLARLYPSRRDRRLNFLSVASILVVHGGLGLAFGSAYVWGFLLPFFIFLGLMEPIIVSQHGGVPVEDSDRAREKPYALRDQAPFSRTLVFPNLITRHVLFGFNLHSVHHERPNAPGNRLHEIPFEARYAFAGFAWSWRAKTTAAARVLDAPAFDFEPRSKKRGRHAS